MTTSWCDSSRKSIAVAHCEQDIVGCGGWQSLAGELPTVFSFEVRTDGRVGGLKVRAAGSVPDVSREISCSKIVEQGHDTSRSLTTGDTFNAHHVGTGRLADKKARAG